jgi:integrase
VATLFKRGKCYYLNWSDGGVQVRRSLGPIDRKTAEALRAEKEAERRGLITPTRGVTMGAVLRDYLAWYETERPTTYRRAKSALQPLIDRFDTTPADSCPPKAVEDWARGRKAKGQAEKAIKLARAAFRRALRQRVVHRSPLDGVTLSKPLTSRAPPYYRPDQLKALTGGNRGHLWTFMAQTGVRMGEMAKARRQDVRDGMLYVESLPTGRTKNLKWRAIPLTPAAAAALDGMGEDRLVPVHRDTLGDWFRRDAGALGLPGSLHWLRHTFCTALAQSGVSLHEIKRLAGHSSITVTEQYAHHLPDFGRHAVATLAAWTESDSPKTAQPESRNTEKPP